MKVIADTGEVAEVVVKGGSGQPAWFLGNLEVEQDVPASVNRSTQGEFAC